MVQCTLPSNVSGVRLFITQRGERGDKAMTTLSTEMPKSGPSASGTWPRERYYMVMIFLFLAGILWIVASRVPEGANTRAMSAPRPGFLAPDFELLTLEGETMRLSELRGKRVVLNFWATWCPPCRSEMPAFERAYQRYQDRGLIIVAVNEAEDPTAVAAFRNELGLTFPILLDSRMEVGEQYRVRFLPTTYFIAPDGTIIERVEGGMSEGAIYARIQRLMEAR